MRILIVHNFYQHPGGEDVVFGLESALLEKTETVYRLTFQNHTGWRGLLQTLGSVWNIFSARKLRKTIRTFRPDVIHFHNFHYALGPVGIRVAGQAGIPTVVTLHNYRIVCPSATLSHQGKLFTASLTVSFPWKAIRLGVHSHSSVKTAWLAITNWLHRISGTWALPDRYIVLTPFAKNIFVHSSLALPDSKFTIKPNFVRRNHHLHISSETKRTDYFLYVGRLTQEKGIETLINAFETNGYRLRIAGDGPLRALVENSCTVFSNIEYLGMLDETAVQAAMKACHALVFPSIWYEGMPMTIIEAFATGTAVIASNLGAMAAMIDHAHNGLLFEPGNPVALNQQVQYWLNMGDEDRNTIRLKAQQTYNTYYTPEENKTRLMAIYQEVVDGIIS